MNITIIYKTNGQPEKFIISFSPLMAHPSYNIREQKRKNERENRIQQRNFNHAKKEIFAKE